MNGDDLSVHLLCSSLSLTPTLPSGELINCLTYAPRQTGRQTEEIAGKMMGRGGAEGEKGGTSQIGNISFQHVLSEHFVCERRHKGGDPHGSKA